MQKIRIEKGWRLLLQKENHADKKGPCFTLIMQRPCSPRHTAIPCWDAQNARYFSQLPACSEGGDLPLKQPVFRLELARPLFNSITSLQIYISHCVAISWKDCWSKVISFIKYMTSYIKGWIISILPPNTSSRKEITNPSYSLSSLNTSEGWMGYLDFCDGRTAVEEE